MKTIFENFAKIRKISQEKEKKLAIKKFDDPKIVCSNKTVRTSLRDSGFEGGSIINLSINLDFF